MDHSQFAALKPRTFKVLAWLVIFGCLAINETYGAEVAAMPRIIAHRGASHDAPENTLAAFRLAWEQGADGVEGDYYLTKDGEVVCIHDATTGRTGDRDLKVASSTLAELRGRGCRGETGRIFSR